jgi:hypothetical protein
LQNHLHDEQLLKGPRRLLEHRGIFQALSSWPLCHLPLPSEVSQDLCGSFAIKTLHIVTDVFIVRVPCIKIAKQEVMISAPGFTERDQVVWIQFQMRMKMETLFSLASNSQHVVALLGREPIIGSLESISN